MASDRELRSSTEILPGRLYYVALSAGPPSHAQKHFFSIDNELVYWNFFLDFGPLNLGQLYRFCVLLNNKLSDNRLKDKVIYFFSGTHPHRRTNAAFLICAWAMICLDKSPDEAYKPFRNCNFPAWHDATPSVCTFNLTVLDTLKGLQKARECRFFDFKNFNIEEYEHFEKVENGDLNWVTEGKFIAFAGPHATRETSPGGYQTLTPEHYLSYFKRKNVSLVVRLNKKYYDSRKFTAHGIDHIDLYFLDGSNPPPQILSKFIQKSEETPGAVAVHCKAGLGRTGCCIGAYLMKHYRFTGEEIIGWLRIVRPGSIIGPQQEFMKSIETQMWREGEMHRTRLSPQLKCVADNAKEVDEGKDGNSGNGASLSQRMASLGLRSNVRDRDTPPPATLLSNGSSKDIGRTSSSSSLAAAIAREESGADTQGDHLRARRQQCRDEASMLDGNTSGGGGVTPPPPISRLNSRSSSMTFSVSTSSTSSTSVTVQNGNGRLSPVPISSLPTGSPTSTTTTRRTSTSTNTHVHGSATAATASPLTPTVKSIGSFLGF